MVLIRGLLNILQIVAADEFYNLVGKHGISVECAKSIITRQELPVQLKSPERTNGEKTGQQHATIGKVFCNCQSNVCPKCLQLQTGSVLHSYVIPELIVKFHVVKRVGNDILNDDVTLYSQWPMKFLQSPLAEGGILKTWKLYKLIVYIGSLMVLARTERAKESCRLRT